MLVLLSGLECACFLLSGQCVLVLLLGESVFFAFRVSVCLLCSRGECVLILLSR